MCYNKILITKCFIRSVSDNKIASCHVVKCCTNIYGCLAATSLYESPFMITIVLPLSTWTRNIFSVKNFGFNCFMM